jgi:hypothetical protein
MQNNRYLAYRFLYIGLGTIIVGVILFLFNFLLPDFCLWSCDTPVPEQVFAPTDVPVNNAQAFSEDTVAPTPIHQEGQTLNERPVVPVRFNGNCTGNDRIVGVDVTASDFAPQSKDDAGNPTFYYPYHTLDCRPDTSWRTAFRGDNPWLEYTFDEPVVLTSVMLKPGYDKTDPLTGRDRWYQNWRVRSVRFDAYFTDGGSCSVDWYNISDSAVMQRFDLASCVGTGEVYRLRMTITDGYPPNDSDPRIYVAISDMMFEGVSYE